MSIHHRHAMQRPWKDETNKQPGVICKASGLACTLFVCCAPVLKSCWKRTLNHVAIRHNARLEQLPSFSISTLGSVGIQKLHERLPRITQHTFVLGFFGKLISPALEPTPVAHCTDHGLVGHPHFKNMYNLPMAVFISCTTTHSEKSPPHPSLASKNGSISTSIVLRYAPGLHADVPTASRDPLASAYLGRTRRISWNQNRLHHSL